MKERNRIPLVLSVIAATGTGVLTNVFTSDGSYRILLLAILGGISVVATLSTSISRDVFSSILHGALRRSMCEKDKEKSSNGEDQ